MLLFTISLLNNVCQQTLAAADALVPACVVSLSVAHLDLNGLRAQLTETLYKPLRHCGFKVNTHFNKARFYTHTKMSEVHYLKS